MARQNSNNNNTRGGRQSKKVARAVPKGRLYVSATFNSTLASVTDDKGNVLCWSSTGESGFSGSRKSTPFAATVAVENALNKSRAFGMNEVDVFIKGIGPGRDVTLNVLRTARLKVGMIVDKTPIPHNGTRSRKAKHNR
jgi:small subunit ribosomal protein S11